MSYQNESFGMMDEGYFVPKSQILSWLNDVLQLNLTKIQQLGAASVYCQVTDIIHPGTVAMNKVNWKAKNDYQFIANLKILQNAFAKAGIKRYIEVEKLARAKYQDNLEFIQWLKRYYDKNCGDRGASYNAEQKRGGVVPDFSFADKNVVPKTYNATGVVLSNKGPVAEKPKKKEQTTKQQPQPHRVKSPVTTRVKKQQPKPIKSARVSTAIVTPKKALPTKNNENQQLQEQKAKVQDLQLKLCMITEVIKSEDSSDMKIKLLTQILELNKQTNKTTPFRTEDQTHHYQEKGEPEQQYQEHQEQINQDQQII